LHANIYDQFKEKLMKSYDNIKIGDPLDDSTICGPLMGENAVKIFVDGIEEIKKQGGKIIKGGKVINRIGYYVEPTLVEIDPHAKIVQEELFVPILYLFKFSNIEEAIKFNNSVP